MRTLVAREEKRRGKDRWHALFVFRDNATPALALIQEFRARQHHEQTYRVLLHDAFVDTVPSGYFKKSPNPDKPGFRKGAITLYAWLAGLAVNALRSFSSALPQQFHLAHPRTLRRWWLTFPADLYLSDKVLFVLLRPRWHRSWWQQQIQHLNAKKIRAYLHLIDPVPGHRMLGPEAQVGPSPVPLIRQRFSGPVIVNGGYDLATSRAALESGVAAIAFGLPFLANPDLPERLRRGATLNAPDPATYYGGGERGYTDYPTLAEEAAPRPTSLQSTRWTA